MKIELAYPWTDDKDVDHRAGTKLEVSAEVARRLITDGRAREVSEPRAATKASGNKQGSRDNG